VPLPPSTNKTHTDLDPSKIFPRDSLVPISLFNSDTHPDPVPSGQWSDFDPDLTGIGNKIGFGAVPPDPILWSYSSNSIRPRETKNSV
jgi:hypothetical protein